MSTDLVAMVSPSSPVAILTDPRQLVQVREHWIQTKREELARADQVLVALKDRPGTHAKIQRVKDRVRVLRKFLRALEGGYMPIPRFDSETLRLEVEELPAQAIIAMAAAEETGAFDEVRFVRGREGDTRRGPHARRAPRDPLLVGVIRTPDRHVEDRSSWNGQRRIPGFEEHFLIAWWRPEDELPDAMF
jgi:hypothetical protein